MDIDSYRLTFLPLPVIKSSYWKNKKYTGFLVLVSTATSSNNMYLLLNIMFDVDFSPFLLIIDFFILVFGQLNLRVISENHNKSQLKGMRSII